MMRNWNRDEPEQDAEDFATNKRPIVGKCEECRCEIEKGNPHYEIDGILLCDDYECLISYMKANYGKEE